MEDDVEACATCCHNYHVRGYCPYVRLRVRPACSPVHHLRHYSVPRVSPPTTAVWLRIVVVVVAVVIVADYQPQYGVVLALVHPIRPHGCQEPRVWSLVDVGSVRLGTAGGCMYEYTTISLANVPLADATLARILHVHDGLLGFRQNALLLLGVALLLVSAFVAEPLLGFGRERKSRRLAATLDCQLPSTVSQLTFLPRSLSTASMLSHPTSTTGPSLGTAPTSIRGS